MSFIPPKNKDAFLRLAEMQNQLDKLQLSLDNLLVQKRDLCVHIENCKTNIKYLKKNARIVNMKYYGEITSKFKSHIEDLNAVEKTAKIHREAIKRLRTESQNLEQHLKQAANNIVEFKNNAKKS